MGTYNDSQQGYRVFVGGISPRVTKYDLEQEFERFGRINDVWVARNPPGFGFVVFKHSDEADQAIRKMDKRRCFGSILRVEHANQPYRSSGGRGGGRRSRSRSPVRGSRNRRSRDRSDSRRSDTSRSRRRDDSGDRSSRRKDRSCDRKRSSKSDERRRRRSPSEDNASPARGRRDSSGGRARSNGRSKSRSSDKDRGSRGRSGSSGSHQSNGHDDGKNSPDNHSDRSRSRSHS